MVADDLMPGVGKGTAVWLRDVAESDLEQFFQHQREPEGRQMAVFTPKDPEDKETYLAHWHRLLADAGVVKKSILYQGQVAGHLVYFDQFGEKEVGYWLGRDFWGRGIATQALQLFLQEVTVRPVYGRAATDNLASIRVLEKCGFRPCGMSKGFSFARGREVEEVLLRLDARIGEVVLETDRLWLTKLMPADAPFILRLLNEPTFIENIGDRGVRTMEDAEAYILNGPVASYARFGFGLYLVESRATGEAMGLCGLLKREVLDDVDIGYAFLPAFCGNGYAREAATAVLHHAQQTLGLKRLVAIVSPHNQPSIRLLEKIGFRYEKMVRLTANAPEIKLFAWETGVFLDKAIAQTAPII
ncbi:MAG: GNAT family N-acetyltransferase [Anaerolineae bacterium]|nr:GNAT family N-acetyltransferase [Anaerolineae bacterium]